MESMLLGAGKLSRHSFAQARVPPVQQAHFERRLTLSVATVSEDFAVEKSEEAKGARSALAIALASVFRTRRFPQRLHFARPPAQTE